MIRFLIYFWKNPSFFLNYISIISFIFFFIINVDPRTGVSWSALENEKSLPIKE